MSDLHPECEKMHALGYCLCVTVDCIGCDLNHPPHKPCGLPVVAIAQAETADEDPYPTNTPNYGSDP